MKLRDIFNRTPLESLIYMERYVCKKNYHKLAGYSEISPRYQPQNRNKAYNLPLFKTDIRVYGQEKFVPPLLRRFFPMHPDTAHDLHLEKKPGQKSFVVRPTSSTRTVLASLGQSIFLKLSVDRFITRSKRSFGLKQIAHGLAVSDDLRNACKSSSDKIKDFGFFEESVGLTTSINNKEIGAIIRKSKPYPFTSSQRWYIPCVSLYSKDDLKPHEDPLLVQLIESQKANPLSFTINNIIEPVMRHFNYIASERGILFESHAQNTLLELNRSGKITRILYRDFGSLTIDQTVRKKKKLTPFAHYNIGTKERMPRAIEYSTRYDIYMADHFFDLLGSTLRDYFDVPKAEFKKSVRGAFFKTMSCKKNFRQANILCL